MEVTDYFNKVWNVCEAHGRGKSESGCELCPLANNCGSVDWTSADSHADLMNDIKSTIAYFRDFPEEGNTAQMIPVHPCVNKLIPAQACASGVPDDIQLGNISAMCDFMLSDSGEPAEVGKALNDFMLERNGKNWAAVMVELGDVITQASTIMEALLRLPEGEGHSMKEVMELVNAKNRLRGYY